MLKRKRKAKRSAIRKRKSTGKRATPRPSKLLRNAVNWFAAKHTTVTPVEKVTGDRDFTTIENVASFRNPIGAVAVMVRKAGNVAAEHFHAREGHTCYLVSGRAQYRERRHGATGFTYADDMLPGKAIFSPPNVPHAFLFLEDSVMVVIANISRTKAEYEADVTRLADGEKLFSEDDIAVARREALFISGASPFPPGTVGKSGQLRAEQILDGEPKLYLNDEAKSSEEPGTPNG